LASQWPLAVQVDTCHGLIGLDPRSGANHTVVHGSNRKSCRLHFPLHHLASAQSGHDQAHRPLLCFFIYFNITNVVSTPPLAFPVQIAIKPVHGQTNSVTDHGQSITLYNKLASKPRGIELGLRVAIQITILFTIEPPFSYGLQWFSPFSYGFPISHVFYCFPMVLTIFLWFSYGFHMFLLFSNGFDNFPMVFPWCSSYGCPMVFTIFLWCSNGFHHFPMVFQWFSPFSYGVPMVFTIFLYGVPMVFTIFL